MDMWEPIGHAWTSTEVLLDIIFNFLDPQDLKNARLACRKWAIEGSRHLTRKTSLRLSQATTPWVKNHGRLLLPHWRDDFVETEEGRRLFQDQEEFAEYEATNRIAPNYDDNGYLDTYENDTWESTSDLQPHEYFTIDAYLSYINSAVFSSEFKPRSVLVYTFTDLLMLPMPHFSFLERLQIVFVESSEVYVLLNEVVVVFPSLKSLKIGNIVPAGSNSLPSVHNLRPSASREFQQHSSNLEELWIPVPADLLHLDWSFLASFSKLKELHIQWPGSVCFGDEDLIPDSMESSLCFSQMSISYGYSRNFGSWIQKIRSYFNWSRLRTIGLRFELMPNNIECLRSLLKSAVNLETLSLQVFGTVEKTLEFIQSLDRKTVALMKDPQFSVDIMLLQRKPEKVITILKALDDKGFFLKKIWSITFRYFGGCCCLEKKESGFIFRRGGHGYQKNSFITAILWDSFPALFANHNYNYAYLVSTNEFGETRSLAEAIGSEVFLDHHSLMSKLYVSSDEAKRRLCQTCARSRFICDSPGFQQAAGFSLGHHSKEFNTYTYCFMHVPHSVMTKIVDKEKLKQVSNALNVMKL